MNNMDIIRHNAKEILRVCKYDVTLALEKLEEDHQSLIQAYENGNRESWVKQGYHDYITMRLEIINV